MIFDASARSKLCARAASALLLYRPCSQPSSNSRVRFAVEPDRPAHGDVADAQAADLGWPAAGEALELHHGADQFAQVGERGVDRGLGDGADRRGLARGRAVLLEAVNGAERLEDRGREQFLGSRPLEGAADAIDRLVDRAPREAALDQADAHGLERERAERRCRGRAVELAQWPEGQAVAMQFGCRGALGVAIVLLGEGPKAVNEFIDREVWDRAAGVGRIVAAAVPAVTDLAAILKVLPPTVRRVLMPERLRPRINAIIENLFAPIPIEWFAAGEPLNMTPYSTPALVAPDNPRQSAQPARDYR